MTYVGAPLAAGKSTSAGNFRSSPGKTIQLLKEFLAYALLTRDSFQNHSVHKYDILTIAKRVYFTKSKQYGHSVEHS